MISCDSGGLREKTWEVTGLSRVKRGVEVVRGISWSFNVSIPWRTRCEWGGWESFFEPFLKTSLRMSWRFSASGINVYLQPLGSSEKRQNIWFHQSKMCIVHKRRFFMFYISHFLLYVQYCLHCIPFQVAAHTRRAAIKIAQRKKMERQKKKKHLAIITTFEKFHARPLCHSPRVRSSFLLLSFACTLHD